MRKALALNPDPVEPALDLGELLCRVSKSKVTKLEPKSTRGHFELDRLYQAKGDKDNALAAYHRALTLAFGED